MKVKQNQTECPSYEQLDAELKRIRPDIVHLHNIHGHDCHFGRLFGYLKEKNIKVFYTNLGKLTLKCI